MPASILDSYVSLAPSHQNALDIFKGEWASKFPVSHADLRAGGIPLFEDTRMAWALQELGGIGGQDVLELGPLEGGHSFMLQQAGARSVTSIEANTRAFLKCLIVKEMLDLSKVHFRCGSFIPFLEHNERRYDLVVAAGVLYHMVEPAHLISLIASCTEHTYIWTHYYDADVIGGSENLRPHFPSRCEHTVSGFQHTLHRQEYGAALLTDGFCGGSQAFSNWMSRYDILRCLKHFGFADLRIAHEQPDHPHGPCFSILARKTA